MKGWFLVWQEFMQPDVQALIRDRYTSRYMRLAVFLRECKKHGVA